MLITDRARLRGRTLAEVASPAAEGGAHAVQIREKDLSTAELYELAAPLHAALRGRALLLVNGRIDVALAIGADGVHFPERGLPAKKARDLVKDVCLLGRSVHSVKAALTAEADGADYVQVGPIYETTSKPGVTPAGLDLVTAVRDAVRIPVVAVGGIDATNAADVIAAGADGVAVIGAIMDAGDPAGAARELRAAVDAAYAHKTPAPIS